MHQPSLPVVAVNPGTGQRSSPNWAERVRQKIQREAEDVASIPTYYRNRFDAFRNEDYPSIFKPNHRAAVPMLSRAAAPPSQQPLYHTGDAASTSREPAQSTSPGGGRVIVAAVGPYHHLPDTAYGRPHPPFITHAKKCAIVKFITREKFDTPGFLGWARDQEGRVRSCYERDSFAMDPEELAEMLLLDGCLLLFAVFLLRPSVRDDKRPAQLTRDAGQGKDFMYLSADIMLNMKQTRLDMLMLGNQIPFFVLTELHNRLKDTFFQGIEPSIKELALSCFEVIHPLPLALPHERAADLAELRVHHLLHLFHWSRLPKDSHKLDDSSLLAQPESYLPCATWFEESQASFSNKAAPGPGSSSLHIVFHSTMLGARAVMHVPALHIHDYSESVFRSLIAFEQNHLRCGLGVTAYSICMARLLQTEADAKLLRESGILEHTHKTDKEIVGLFNGLADEYSNTFYSGDLLDLFDRVTAHNQRKAAKAAKWVSLRCFPRQSVTFFVIFGALISIATLINTGYSVYRFYHSVE